MCIYYIIVIAFSLLHLTEAENESSCNTKETCSDCIQTFGCIWCSKPSSSNGNETGRIFCRHESITDREQWCPRDKTVDPQFNRWNKKNDPLRSQSSDEPAIQITPQRVQIDIRKGQEYQMNFQYRQAENYPVDLYYIMDLSASMENHREKLAQLGGKLIKTMQNLTSNFRVGFGSFVDKTDLPFVSTVPEKLKSPCTLKNVPCLPPYSFKNHLSLTDNADIFSSEVQKARVSGNLDFPEGGFDAVMQAMVCKKEIGWRENARHLIVFSTDADFHIAGDGKLAGVVEPNDAQCHMENNAYTHDLVYDYPSVSQLNYVAKQNNINLVFAIVKEGGNDRLIKIYKKLQQRVENSAVSGLTTDNVVSLVVDNYNKIVESVTIKDNSTSDIEIKYSSNCSKPIENGCNNVHVGDIINFTATIRPLKCSTDKFSSQIIRIRPEGISESLFVELNVTCDCDCEHAGHDDYESQSGECTGQGNLKCGVCSCNSGRFGRNCECDNTATNIYDTTACKQHEDDTEVCSGLGTCKCGKCECVKRVAPQKIYGKYCQCDNYSCKRNNGQVCSGSDHGTCECGECKCSADWTGDACECPNTNITCIAPGNAGVVCSGHGSCSCGDCICDMIDGYRYYGRYCEECPSCEGQRCQELRHCVECKVYKTGIYTETECDLKCTAFIITEVDEVNVTDSDIKICRSPDNSGCTMLFSYVYGDKNEVIIEAQREKQCSESVDLWAVIVGVVVSIVLAGIVLLVIWKVFTVIHDRREYAKFENERSKAKWQQGHNPLYKPSTTNFQNPLYGR